MTVMNLDKDEIYNQITAQAESIGKQLNHYIAYFKRSKQGEKEMPTGYTVRKEPVSYPRDTPGKEFTD